MLQRLSHAARTGGGGGGGLRSRESSFQDESPHQEEEAGGRESVIEVGGESGRGWRPSLRMIVLCCAVSQRAGKVEVGIKRGLSRLLEMLYGAVGYTISGTTGLMVTAASNTPGLKEIVLTKVHRYFYYHYYYYYPPFFLPALMHVRRNEQRVLGRLLGGAVFHPRQSENGAGARTHRRVLHGP